jgi:hypothetical protein
LLELCLCYALSTVIDWRHELEMLSLSFMRLWKGGGTSTQATAQALAAGPQVILLALCHGGQAFTPHARTRLLHMPTKPKPKAPQSSIPSPKLIVSTPRPLVVVGVPRFVLE